MLVCSRTNHECCSDVRSDGLAVSQIGSALKDGVEHLFGQGAGIGILLAGMVRGKQVKRTVTMSGRGE